MTRLFMLGAVPAAVAVLPRFQPVEGAFEPALVVFGIIVVLGVVWVVREFWVRDK